MTVLFQNRYALNAHAFCHCFASSAHAEKMQALFRLCLLSAPKGDSAQSALAAGKKSTFLQTKKASVCLLLLVGRGGFEPPKSVTTDLQSAPFGHSGIFPYFGAGDRNRTNNLLITNQLLCLLSYTSAPQYAVVPRGGLEPPTRGFSVPCYYQLSYRGKKMAIRKGLEPSTSSVTG